MNIKLFTYLSFIFLCAHIFTCYTAAPQSNPYNKIIQLIQNSPESMKHVLNAVTSIYNTANTLNNFVATSSPITANISSKLDAIHKKILATNQEQDVMTKLAMSLDVISQLLKVVQELNDLGKQLADVITTFSNSAIAYLHPKTAQYTITTATQIKSTIAACEAMVTQILNTIIDPLKKSIEDKKGKS